LLEALDRHERDVSEAFTLALGGYVEDRPDMLVYVTGLPAHFANGVKAPRLRPADVGDRIEAVSALLRSAGVPGAWALGPLATPSDLGERLEAAGLTRHDIPMMAADMDRLGLDRADPAGLQIRRVEGAEDHQAWLRVMGQGFGMDEGDTETIDQTARVMGYDANAQWVRFVGVVAGAAVASSGLMVFGGPAVVYNVATVPTARRRGFGEAMTRAALRYALGLGYRVAALGTSDMGRSVYERMGFRDVGVLRQYVFDPSGG
jgi:ribosomal protein S18 acetylase RimI-like enzyme